MSRASLIYGGRLERLFANLIDMLILIIPGVFLLNVLPHGGLLMLATFLCQGAYYTYFTASLWQATPGKRLLGIYVIRTDRRMLTPRDALERFLAYSLPALPLYSSLIPDENSRNTIVFMLSLFWFLPILFTPERVGYHDRLCNTRVVVGRVGL